MVLPPGPLTQWAFPRVSAKPPWLGVCLCVCLRMCVRMCVCAGTRVQECVCVHVCVCLHACLPAFGHTFKVAKRRAKEPS